MCGIAGIFRKDPNAVIDESLLWKMIKIIMHRGPDAQKVWSNQAVGFAHARLSIIDLDERSNQPMVDLETGRMIVYNGEVYNYLELKEELVKKGYRFHTHSDTEVILKAYDCWGVECLNRFNGMWGFAIYDPKNKQLFAARDRFGVKPFVYAMHPNGDLIFASEPKAITGAFPEFNKPNMPFLSHFVERDFFACYQDTFYENMYNLLPGHYFIIKNGDIPRQERYWNWTPKLIDSCPSDHEAKEQFQYLLQDAIKLRLRSDVPVGSCLSGGLDSPTIVGLATKLSGKQVSTFSCVYPDMPHFDESYYIDQIIKRYNTNYHFTTPSHDNFIQAMQNCVFEQDGPTGGPSVLSQRAVMELAKGNVIVLLDGQGADEVLGGYHGYFYYSMLSHLREKSGTPKFWSWLEFYKRSRQINKRMGKHGWSFKHLRSKANDAINFSIPNWENSQLRAMAPFENDDLNTLLLEHTLANLPNLLHYEDRNSMAFSLETRLPFLDYRLVEFAFSLPHHYKIRGKTTKWLLYNVAKQVLPNTVLNRKDKMGYTTPGHNWFREKENLKFFQKYMQSSILDEVSTSHKQYLEKAWDKIYGNNKMLPEDAGYVNALWRLCTANMWLESISA